VGAHVQLGAQDLCAAPGLAHTGQISASLLADVGCEWVMLNHWEVRRRTDESDAEVNLKLHAAFQAGLRPMLLIGEAAAERGRAEEALTARLPALIANCPPEHVARMAMLYEPEWTIGVEEPAAPLVVAAGCACIRGWFAHTYGQELADGLRILYGGSVTPASARSLLLSPDVDGVGASRKGRDPAAFAELVRLVATAKESA
jgi:triosephosphate isomerase